ncbi:fibroblast growth factor-binding protein 2b [Pholidichthys leucotaenia]
MMVRMRMMLLLLSAAVCVSSAQNSNSNDTKLQQSSIWDEPIKFNTKAKDSCTMVASGAGDYTRLRVSCKVPSQASGRSYYCDFQGKPTLCHAYNLNPRHYFTQMMWELRKLNHACQGAKIYRQHMCRKFPDEAQMTFLTSWPKSPKTSKPMQERRKPAHAKPAATPKPVKNQSNPIKTQPGKRSHTRKSSPKPGKTTTTTTPPPAMTVTELPESAASRLASEYCWKSFHGICTYFINWFQ